MSKKAKAKAKAKVKVEKTSKILTDSDVTAIRDVMHALIAHRKVLESLPKNDDIDDLIEGMDISYTKLACVLDPTNPDKTELHDALQTVILNADDYLNQEQENKFEGWDTDDVVDTNTAIEKVRKHFNL